MNTAESTDVLVDIVLDVDWDKEPECEGALHPFGTGAHDGGPAKWIVKTPCGCAPLLLCNGRALLHRTLPLSKCMVCGETCFSSDMKFIEL